MENVIFLRKNSEGKLTKTATIENADFVRVPANNYVSVNDWNSLVDKYSVLSEQYDNLCKTNEDTGSVSIPKEEYVGLQNMLRILKDRSLQQIDKAKADQYGYTFKYSDIRVYDKTNPNLKAYFVSKATPISLKIDFKTAYHMILCDLGKYYNYIDLERVKTLSYAKPSPIKPSDLLLARIQRKEPGYKYNFYIDNSDYGRKVKEFIDESPEEIIFEISKVGSNIGLGIYEISYWATAPI